MSDLTPPAVVVPHRGRDARTTLTLIQHLVGRELRVRYRRTRFGLFWGVLQPLIRFAVMGFVFGAVARLGIPNYAEYLFIGILVWTWFSGGISGATTSAVENAELTGHPGLPRMVIPLVPVVTTLMDMALAFPILIGILLFTGGIPGTIVLLPILVVVQGTMIAGFGLLGCASNVYFRDTKPIVETIMTVGFYAVPVVYEVEMAPDAIQPYLEASPITILIQAYRSILMFGEVPAAGPLLWAFGFSVVVLAAGVAVFRRASPNFLDEL